VAEDDRGEENAEGEGEGFILRSVQTTARVVAGCEGNYLFSGYKQKLGAGSCPCPATGDDRR
jgi:hypothetical protein